MNTVAECMHWAESVLAAQSEALAECAKVDSQWLLSFVLEKNITWLRAWPDNTLTPKQLVAFKECIARRKNGEPVAYITGRQGFWTLDLSVNNHTLVPRPDTELLVELALALPAEPLNVVDLGTGTGAIALALKSERQQWQVTATDISPHALAVAKNNAERFNLPVEFIESSWFEQLGGRQFNLIVSNPPYIETRDAHLNGLGVAFEPLGALVSGEDGLDAIRELTAIAPTHLLAGGWLMLEHGYNQGRAVRALLLGAGFQQVRTEQDLGQNDRVTLGQWPGALTSETGA